MSDPTTQIYQLFINEGKFYLGVQML